MDGHCSSFDGKSSRVEPAGAIAEIPGYGEKPCRQTGGGANVFNSLRFPLGAIKKDHRGIGVLRC